MVEPSFLALTSTPSIRPSSLEETCPLRVRVCAGAPTEAKTARTLDRLTDAKRWLRRMAFLPVTAFARACPRLVRGLKQIAVESAQTPTSPPLQPCCHDLPPPDNGARAGRGDGACAAAAHRSIDYKECGGRARSRCAGAAGPSRADHREGEGRMAEAARRIRVAFVVGDY